MRNFDKAKRVVIKIGTNILSKNNNMVADYAEGKKSRIKNLATDFTDLSSVAIAKEDCTDSIAAKRHKLG